MKKKTNWNEPAADESDMQEAAAPDFLGGLYGIPTNLPIDADAPERRREPTPLQWYIERALKQLNIQADLWTSELADQWSSLLPPDLAAVTCPGKYENGTLYVYVSSSTKLFEIRRFKLKLIEEAVRKAAGTTRTIHQVRLLLNPDQ